MNISSMLAWQHGFSFLHNGDEYSQDLLPSTNIGLPCSYSLSWLVFCQLDAGWNYLLSRNPSWESAFITLSCKENLRVFYSLMIYEGGSSLLWVAYPWAASPEFYKNAGWASLEEETNKQHSFMASGSSLGCPMSQVGWQTMIWIWKRKKLFCWKEASCWFPSCSASK